MKWIKKHKGLTIGLAVVLVLGVTAAFVLPGLFSKNTSGGVMPKQNMIKLEKMSLTDSVSATGTIESAKSSTVSANVQNIEVKDVLVEVGEKVKKGQKLVVFDKSELKQSLDDAKEEYSDTVSQASSDVSQAYESLSDAKTTYAEDKKKLKKALKTAKANLKKAKEAAGAPGADEKQLEQAQTAYDQAKEEYENKNSQNKKSIKTASQQVTTALNNKNKQVKQAKKQVDQAKETYEAAAIVSNMSGTVTKLGVKAGDTYNGSEAAEISNLDSFQVTTTVTEYDIAKVKTGQKAVILTDATGDEEINGKVTYVALTSGSSSLSSEASGNTMSMGGSSSSSSDSDYEVVITLDSVPDSIRAGMTAKCSIILNEAENVYAVPYDAIHTDDDGKNVIYAFDSSGSRKEISVEKGMETDYYVEIKSNDLSEELSVIIPTDSTDNNSGSSDEKGNDTNGFGGFMNGGGMPGGGDMQPPGDSQSGGFPGAK
ncbi:MAG: efflux RND transporter periplasmic adaptor subunit [Eubacterium sp.]|nr:efflux RND transporter periplasmic adaptor subunit [Eubacterium sp.]